jgi:TRAP-type C4-dicarboxylate transport system permease small subunit
MKAPGSIGAWLRRRAEDVAVILLATIFLAFIAQIVFRYLLNFPVGWTSELSTVAWIWLVLWGAAFVLREDEEIRFDIIYGSVGPAARRLMLIVTAAALVALYTVSLPAVIDYVAFMKVQETSYLDIRFDLLFSIYVIFAVAAILRYLWLGWRALLGNDPGPPDPTKAGSGV